MVGLSEERFSVPEVELALEAQVSPSPRPQQGLNEVIRPREVPQHVTAGWLPRRVLPLIGVAVTTPKGQFPPLP